MKPASKFNQVRIARKDLPKTRVRIEKPFSFDEALTDPRNTKIGERLLIIEARSHAMMECKQGLEKRCKANRSASSLLYLAMLFNALPLIYNIFTLNPLALLKSPVFVCLFFQLESIANQSTI